MDVRQTINWHPTCQRCGRPQCFVLLVSLLSSCRAVTHRMLRSDELARAPGFSDTIARTKFNNSSASAYGHGTITSSADTDLPEISSKFVATLQLLRNVLYLRTSDLFLVTHLTQ